MPRPLSDAFSSLRFLLVKGPNSKYNAYCTVCKKTLRNTAAARLRAHRNRCRLESELGPALNVISPPSVSSKTCTELSVDYSKNHDPPLIDYSVGDEEEEPETTNVFHDDPRYDDLDVNMQIVDIEAATRDECVAFGQYVTTQLRKMDSKTCAVVKFKIYETLYNAEIGILQKEPNT